MATILRANIKRLARSNHPTIKTLPEEIHFVTSASSCIRPLTLEVLIIEGIIYNVHLNQHTR